MDAPAGSASDGAAPLAVLDDLDDPHAPVTTGTVADELDCARSAARQRLEALVREGRLKCTETDAGERVWWRPAEQETDAAEDDRDDEFRAFVQAVEEYAIFVMDEEGYIQTWNPGAAQIKGYAEPEIVGEHFSIFYTDDARDAGIPERNLRTAAAAGHVTDEGWRVRADGTRFWANVTITSIEGADGAVRGFAKVTKDMTERKRREEQLDALNEVARELMAAETVDAVIEIAIEAAASDLRLPAATIALYDEDRGALRSAGRTALAERLADDVALFDPRSDVVWDVFGEREPSVESDLGVEFGDAGDGRRVTAGAAFPLGRHGVLLVGFTTQGGVDATAFEFPKLVAADLEAALNHVERQRLLREREEALEEQNRTLERLNRINGIIRNIDQALVDATSREGVEQAVCDQLATVAAYRFAWIGRQHSSGGAIDPVAWAGDGTKRVDELAAALSDDSTGRRPAAVAARSRAPNAVTDLRSDPPFEPWRKEALKHGCRSVLSVPLCYGSSLYGILTVFADRPNGFDGLERRVLEELGETIGHAINALESKRALVSDEVVELEFRIGDPDGSILRLATALECELEFENVVSLQDGRYRGYFVTRRARPDDVRAFAGDSPAFDDVGLVADDEGECLFECTLTADSLVATLLDHGAVPQTITAGDGRSRVVVALARDADVREFAEMLATKYPDSELTARRTRRRQARAHHTFRADFESRLTERQRETLQTAYFSGFFESPRKRTGQEIGESLGVSQPTVNHHLRAGQRKLLGMLYDEEPPSELTGGAGKSR